MDEKGAERGKSLGAVACAWAWGADWVFRAKEEAGMPRTGMRMRSSVVPGMPEASGSLRLACRAPGSNAGLVASPISLRDRHEEREGSCVWGRWSGERGRPTGTGGSHGGWGWLHRGRTAEERLPPSANQRREGGHGGAGPAPAPSPSAPSQQPARAHLTSARRNADFPAFAAPRTKTSRWPRSRHRRAATSRMPCPVLALVCGAGGREGGRELCIVGGTTTEGKEILPASPARVLGRCIQSPRRLVTCKRAAPAPA